MEQSAGTRTVLYVLNKLRKRHLLPSTVHDVFVYSPYANETMCWITEYMTKRSKALHASCITQEDSKTMRNKLLDRFNWNKNNSLYDQIYEENEHDLRASAEAIVQSTLNALAEQNEVEEEEEEQSLHFTVLSDSVSTNNCALYNSSSRQEWRQQSRYEQKRDATTHHTYLPISLHDLACYVKTENALKTTRGHLQSRESRLMLSSNNSSNNNNKVENRLLQSLPSSEQGAEYRLQTSDLKLLCERGSRDFIVLDCTTEQHTQDYYTSAARSSNKRICGNSEIGTIDVITDDDGVERKELVHNALVVATHLIHPNGALLLVSNSANKVNQAWQVSARWQFNEVITGSVPVHDVNYMYCANLNMTSPHKELDKRDFPGLYGKGVPRPKHWNPYERRKERLRKMKYHSIRPRFTGAHRTGEALLSSLEQQRENEASQQVMDDALFGVTHNMVDTGAYDTTVDN